MPPPHQQSRINLADLKSQMAKLLGPDRARRYFGYLNQLLSLKLSRQEFGRLCLSTIGPENIPLHNRLVGSILKNAFHAKSPPTPSPPKPVEAPAKGSFDRDNCFPPIPMPAVWSNGHVLPPSPRKSRSNVRDRRIKDRPSPLGSNARTEGSSHRLLPPVLMENGDANGPCNLKRLAQNPDGGPAEHPAKRAKRTPSPHGQVSPHSEDAEDLFNSSRGPLQAPIGIPFCHASLGSAHRPLPPAAGASSSSYPTNYGSGELCDTESLRKRMEVVAKAQGLEGVRIDCASLLNNGLNVYLKQLIRSCVQLVGARLGHEPPQQPHKKPNNGVWLENHMHVPSSGGSLGGTRERYSISLQDFKVAMELNSQQLGVDWPLLLEKICFSSFEE